MVWTFRVMKMLRTFTESVWAVVLVPLTDPATQVTRLLFLVALLCGLMALWLLVDVACERMAAKTGGRDE